MNVHIDPTPQQPVDADKIGFLGLFAARKPIYVAKVHGRYRSLKWAVMVFALACYYLFPLIRWNRGETAPDQAVLIDILGRKFYFFFIELWPQEIFYFTGILLLAALGLFIGTTLFGRVWCGYFCPQTVWTDLFLHVERFFEGDRHTQQRLAEAPWSLNKILRKLGKHLTWLVIGLFTGGAVVFYFNDAPTLLKAIVQGQAGFTPLFWMGFFTFTTYLMAGFAREQVCTYMCPYARFQGAMYDEDSLLVTYDTARGEPRGKAGSTEGDCVDCGRCVAVCPVGIDIRDGQQYRCINCGLCVDACNTVMEKLGREPNLIRYNTLNNTISGKRGFMNFLHEARLIRFRTLYYAIIMAVVSGTMLYALTHRPLVMMNVLHQRNPMYVMLSNGTVRNTYTVRVVNKTWQPATFTLADTLTGSTLHTEGTPMPAPTVPINVAPGKVAEVTVFAEKPRRDLTDSHTHFTFTLQGPTGETSYATVFVGPETE